MSIPKAIIDFAKDQGKGLDSVIAVANECNITSDELFSVLDTELLNEYVRWLEEEYDQLEKQVRGWELLSMNDNGKD